MRFCTSRTSPFTSIWESVFQDHAWNQIFTTFLTSMQSPFPPMWTRRISQLFCYFTFRWQSLNCNIFLKKNFHFKNWLKYMNTKSTNKFNQENTISSSNIKHWGIQWDLVFLHPPYKSVHTLFPKPVRNRIQRAEIQQKLQLYSTSPVYAIYSLKSFLINEK